MVHLNLECYSIADLKDLRRKIDALIVQKERPARLATAGFAAAELDDIDEILDQHQVLETRPRPLSPRRPVRPARRPVVVEREEIIAPRPLSPRRPVVVEREEIIRPPLLAGRPLSPRRPGIVEKDEIVVPPRRARSAPLRRPEIVDRDEIKLPNGDILEEVKTLRPASPRVRGVSPPPRVEVVGTRRNCPPCSPPVMPPPPVAGMPTYRRPTARF